MTQVWLEARSAEPGRMSVRADQITAVRVVANADTHSARNTLTLQIYDSSLRTWLPVVYGYSREFAMNAGNRLTGELARAQVAEHSAVVVYVTPHDEVDEKLRFERAYEFADKPDSAL